MQPRRLTQWCVFMRKIEAGSKLPLRSFRHRRNGGFLTSRAWGKLSFRSRAATSSKQLGGCHHPQILSARVTPIRVGRIRSPGSKRKPATCLPRPSRSFTRATKTRALQDFEVLHKIHSTWQRSAPIPRTVSRRAPGQEPSSPNHHTQALRNASCSGEAKPR